MRRPNARAIGASMIDHNAVSRRGGSASDAPSESHAIRATRDTPERDPETA